MDGEKKHENGSNPAWTEKTVIEGRDPTGEQREEACRLKCAAVRMVVIGPGQGRASGRETVGSWLWNSKAKRLP
jgi:hypothetical protein